MGSAPLPTLPIEPLVRYVAATLGNVNRLGTPADHRAFYKGTKNGVLPYTAADTLAVRWLDVHPSEIWPEWFELGKVDH